MHHYEIENKVTVKSLAEIENALLHASVPWLIDVRNGLIIDDDDLIEHDLFETSYQLNRYYASRPSKVRRARSRAYTHHRKSRKRL